MRKRFLKWFWLCSLITGAFLQAEWSSPTDISATGGYATSPQIAVDSAGNATAVWYRSNGTNDIIQTSYRAVGENWGTPTDLSETGQNARAPQIAVDSVGNATAVWYRWNGTNHIIQAAYRAVGGNWETPADLSTTGESAIVPQIAVDSAGTVTAVWQRSNGTNNIIQASSRAVGGNWETTADISATGGYALDPQIAVDSAGNATAVWYRWNGTNHIIQAAYRAVGGNWETPADLSTTGESAIVPQIAVDSAGTVTAVWQRSNGTNNIIQAASRAVGGNWEMPADISATGVSAYDPQIAVNSAGNATAVWRRFNGSNYIIQAAYRAVGGNWETPTDISETGRNAYVPQITVDSAGNATAIWERSNGTNEIIQAAYRAVGENWETPTDISAVGGDAYGSQIAVDSTGNATAVWQRSNRTNDIIQASNTVLHCTVTTVSPNVGPEIGGTTVTITGTNFLDVSAVYFGNTAAPNFTLISSTSLTATSPSGSPGTVDVRVMTPAGQSAITSDDHFTYKSPATITNLAPQTGSTSGGTSVTITGTNFLEASSVLFGTTPATDYSITSSTTIVATSPSASPGTVDVRVVTPGGQSAITSNDSFTYQNSSPTRVAKPSHFIGYIYPRHHKHNFSINTRWKPSPSPTVNAYNIYDQHTQQCIATIPISGPLKHHIHFRAPAQRIDDITHRDRHQLNDTYEIRATSLTERPSHALHVRSIIKK